MKRNCRFVRMCAWMASVILLFSACEGKDTRLSKAIDGKAWVLEMEPLEIEDEGVINRMYVMQFAYAEKSSVGICKEIQRVTWTFEDDESLVSWTESSIITGTWHIAGGDLYLKYNLNGLTVALDDYDFQWKDGTPLTQDELEELKTDAEKERSSAFYKEMSEYYQKENEGGCYENVAIDGDVMTFEGANGVLTLHRTNNGK